jgi:hypothetical protein
MQELLIGRMYDQNAGALEPIFFVLMAVSAAALACIGVVYARNRMGKSDV